MPAVFNRYHGNAPQGAVYIGRPSRWGNPFVIGRDGDRAEVIARFKAWLLGQPELLEAVRRDLAGKELVCFCAPAACHGDVLLAVANPEICVARPAAEPGIPAVATTADLFAELQDAGRNEMNSAQR